MEQKSEVDKGESRVYLFFLLSAIMRNDYICSLFLDGREMLCVFWGLIRGSRL